MLLICGCRTTATLPDVAPHRQFRVIGYVRGNTDINAIGAQKLTHLNYAFGKVNPLGLAEFDEPEAPSYIAQLQALKARNPDLKIIVSIGGWGADYFSDAALTYASRCNFVTSAMDMLRNYALDGIDLDWEYPGQPGPGMQFRPEDKENFTALLKMFREELDILSDVRRRRGFDRYTLSIASTGGQYFQHTEMQKLHPYLDWLNVMTYDFSGDWSSTTGHHTPLYRSAAAPPNEPSTESYVQQYLATGIPARKIVVGVAFYGKRWVRANSTNGGLYQKFDRYDIDDEYSYERISREFLPFAGYERRWDAAARAPYLWNPTTGAFVTFDDPQSLEEKARFVRSHGLGGMMYWEHSHDPQEVLLDALFFALR